MDPDKESESDTGEDDSSDDKDPPVKHVKIGNASLSALHSQFKTEEPAAQGYLIMIIEKEDADKELAGATLSYELSAARTIIDKAKQNFGQILIVIISCKETMLNRATHLEDGLQKLSSAKNTIIMIATTLSEVHTKSGINDDSLESTQEMKNKAKTSSP